MRACIQMWCHGCFVCVIIHVGQKVIPPLTPIPVGRQFGRVGADIVQLLNTSSLT